MSRAGLGLMRTRSCTPASPTLAETDAASRGSRKSRTLGCASSVGTAPTRSPPSESDLIRIQPKLGSEDECL